MKRIFLHAPEEGTGCSYYRTTLPTLHCYRDLAARGIELSMQSEILDLDLADAYIFQRLIPDQFLPHLMTLKEAGAYLVFQTDDDLWNLPAWNPALAKLTYNDREATTVALDIVDEIIVGTEPLKAILNKPDKITVLPNLIDPAAFHPRASVLSQYRLGSDTVRIVWAGGNSHDGDLEQIVNPVLRLVEKYPHKVQFIFFGYLPTGLAEFVRLPATEVAYLKPKCEPSILFIPPTQHRLYHDVLMSTEADIALAPLADCLFNLSKSNCKYLETVLAGAAFVGTDLPPYAEAKGRLIPPGDEDGWFNVLDELIANPEEVKRLHEEAREDVLARFTWQSPARELWLNKLASLVER